MADLYKGDEIAYPQHDAVQAPGQRAWHARWGFLYLDEYGEEDPGLVRCSRLFRDSESWSFLEALWRSQQLRDAQPDRWRRPPTLPGRG